jgi:hypothetical protein
MKNLFTLAIALFLVINLSAQDKTKAETLKSFLDGTIAFNAEDINQHEPLISLRKLADENADKTVQLTKENIGSSIDEMKDYSSAVVIVGKHTIAKITDIDDCQQSGAWGACMPKATGYVQKQGQLISHDNYINFIIGVPDNQERTLFLFK